MNLHPVENYPLQKEIYPGFLKILMKVYVDANIYITYLLGEKGEADAEIFFKKGIGCKFIIVASKTTFAEISMICGGRANILLQKHIDDFKNAGKLEIVEKTLEDTQKAMELDLQSKNRYGINDFIHAILAKKHADILVTNDLKFLPTAAEIVKSSRLEKFILEL
ncbi:MAG: PIN domain-containing protein [Candidatus Micrarchaeia archaeon]